MTSQNENFFFRNAVLKEEDELINLALLAYGQYAETLGADNWALMENNIKTKFVNVLEKAKTFVCECDGKIVGIACLIPNGNPDEIFEVGWAHVRMVGVHPDYSSRGICRALMELCLNHARDTNEKTVALHTSEFMDAARHIYERMGFKVLREIPNRFGKMYWLYTLDITGHNP